MDQKAYTGAKRKYNIFDEEEARNAIEFALELLQAERLHLEASEPGAHASISGLEAAWRELSDLASGIEEYMD